MEREDGDKDWLIVSIAGTLYYHVVGGDTVTWHTHSTPVPKQPLRMAVMNSLFRSLGNYYWVYFSSYDQNDLYNNDTILSWATGHHSFSETARTYVESRVRTANVRGLFSLGS